MNWETIRYIYRRVLIFNNKIDYLGANKFRIIGYYAVGGKNWSCEYLDGVPHGKHKHYDLQGKLTYVATYGNGKHIK